LKDKSIGINQHIPLSVLDTGVLRILEKGTIEREELYALMLQQTAGENRAKKAAGYASSILSYNSDLLSRLREVFTVESWSKLPQSDRNAFVICLTCLRYPILFDTLCLLGTQFKIQTSVNRAFINQKMSLKYGSNRTFMVGMDALIPMIIESGIIVRLKVGLYGKNETCSIMHQFIKESWIKTDCILSNIKQISIDEAKYRPWMGFFETTDINLKKCLLLTTHVDAGQRIWVG
jgi:hypothetical protein